jgi:hypothetical protein
MVSNYTQKYIIIYNGRKTYLANDLKQFFPSMFKGLRAVKGIITKYNIPDDQYFVVKVVKGSYIKSDLSYLRSKILIQTGFIDNLLNKLEDLNPDGRVSYKEQQTIQAIKEAFPEDIIYTQYIVGPYKVSLYIKDKLIVEFGHGYEDGHLRYEKEKYIQSTLECPVFRFHPNEPGFSINKLIKDLAITQLKHMTMKCDMQKLSLEYKDQLISVMNDTKKILKRSIETRDHTIEILKGEVQFFSRKCEDK